jgi:hypothetical protein
LAIWTSLNNRERITLIYFLLQIPS